MRFRVLLLVAVAIVLFARPHRASAQCQAAESGEIHCIYQFFDPDFDPGGGAQPNLASDTGTEIGITLAQVHDTAIGISAAIIAGSPLVPPGASIYANQIANIDDTIQSFAAPVVNLQSQPVGDQLQTQVSGASVPQVQGVVPTTNADGTTAAGSNTLMDPVDPVTGEYIIHNVDLELPSFGIPFRFVRVYRSRVDYNGPFGPAWDHSYNQRLFNVPDVPLEGTPDTTPAYARLPVANVTVPKLSSIDSTTCGPQLDLSTGAGTTIRFRENARSGSTIFYRSTADHLTLIGTDSPSGPTWVLTSSHGDARSFDADGRLARWVDANGTGLSFTWSGTGTSARIASVTDSVGRAIGFEYDGTGRITRLSEPASELEATYTYAANGALDTAHAADGHSERYEYDVDASRGRGDWVPEVQLRAGCAAACAHSDSTCDTGGACDDPVKDAMDLCTLYVNEYCAGDCTGACTGACQAACLQEGQYCDSYCEVTNLDELKDTCVDVYDAEASAACNACDDMCAGDADAVCRDAYARGDPR